MNFNQMPYYKEIDLLFIHIPKTGGTSLEDYLKKRYTQTLFGFFENTHHLQHQTYTELYKQKEELLISFNKVVSIVRNPYTRVISDLYHFCLINNNSTPDEVYSELKKYIIRDDLDNHNIPQYRYLLDQTGELNLNNIKIFHTETLTHELQEYGFHDYTSDVVQKDYKCHLNENSIKLINDFYKKDFEVFGYSMKELNESKTNKTICLNMIVKNESKIITRLLESVYFIDYYVICDTGSTDNTIQVIVDFFKSKNIPGIVFHEPFINFCHNRTISLKKCNGLTDYVLLLDADMVLEVNPSFDKHSLDQDNYKITQGSESFYYDNVRIVRNNGNYHYVGVTHEYIATPSNDKCGKITKEILFIRDHGDGGSKTNKFHRDRELLLKGIEDEPTNERYHFYLANTYRDLGDTKNAIVWYKKRINMGGWFDEKYISCVHLYHLMKTHSLESSLYYLVESFNFNSKRVEGISELVKYYTVKGKYQLAWNYYTFIQDYYENEYIPGNGDLSSKLFATIMEYSFYLPYYMIIVCDHLKKMKTGILMYQVIFKRKSYDSQWWINNLLYNIQFYENYLSDDIKESCREYILFLTNKGFTINQNKTIQLINKSLKRNLLFYVGFSEHLWNITFSEDNALGGSELAVCYLAQQFTAEYNVYISGDVLEETKNGVQFINRTSTSKLLESLFIDVLVVSRYVSFFTLFPNYKAKKVYLMAHDTDFLNNLNGCSLTVSEIIKNKKIEKTICLTNWHRETIKEKYPWLDISVINNGINKFEKSFIKKRNSFVYTSCSYRGLKRLLELWPEILLNLPDATLSISSYLEFPQNNDDDRWMETVINSRAEITHFGKLNRMELYELMGKSEYWLYTCSFCETSCITALEMLASEVICFYYPLAGLTYTIGDYGIQVKYGNEVESILELSEKQKMKLRKNGKVYTESCLWENRAREWKMLINDEQVFYYENEFNITPIKEYLNNLGKNVIITNNKTYLGENATVIYNSNYATSLPFNLNLLNTEPLNISVRLNNILSNYKKYKIIYDYSLSNIQIMKKHGITNCEHLPYIVSENEKNTLISLKKSTKISFDFGIISAPGYETNNPEKLTPPRRKKVVDYLLSQGFSVNVISGYGIDRDSEIAKCEYLLNIHGELNGEISFIFEHIRCDRLLKSGYKIISEESQNQISFDGLKFLKYNDFFKLKKNKIIDCFIFYNEDNLLNYRLNLLENVVDYFVIVESTMTFTGKPKEIHSFSDFKLKDRIIHIVVDDFPFPNNPTKEQIWKNEKFQRNCITRGLDKLILNENDILIFSDLDEIPDPKTLEKLKDFNFDGIYSLEQEFYYYNLESRIDHDWYYSKITNYKFYKLSDLNIQNIRESRLKIIPKGGWHLSYFGTPEFISNKINNFSHQEYNSEEFTNLDKIKERIENKKDLFNRNICFLPSNKDYLPPNYNKYYCFIHSCNLLESGTKMLNYLLQRIEHLPFETIFINNIGIPIDKEFGKNIILTNYSIDNTLFEIPTINKLHEFSKNFYGNKILYLHTKGITHTNKCIDDWIEMMLYFLLQEKCLTLDYDTIGCNYQNYPNHYSGNFWWAKTDYLARLPVCGNKKMDAEFWLLSDTNVNCISLHNSGINHYCEPYPCEKYKING